jgi:hypothetical protein
MTIYGENDNAYEISAGNPEANRQLRFTCEDNIKTVTQGIEFDGVGSTSPAQERFL